MGHLAVWSGCSIIQLGQPVAFTSHALTSAVTRYAQIEKELLLIVYACEKFVVCVSMIDQVTVVCASCNYHLRRLLSIQRYLTPEATRCAVQVLTSLLDYCNSLLLGLPLAQIERLQRI